MTPAPPAAPARSAYTAPGPSAAPAARHCPDCGHPAPLAFCPQCGQEQRDRVHTSVRELAGEGLGELLDVDAKVLRTLRTLVLRPGVLTAAYLAGRRTRYVRPLRVYLTLSVLYFLALSLPDGAARPAELSLDVSARASADSTANAIRAVAAELGDTTADAAFERAAKRRIERLGAMDPAEQRRTFAQGFADHAPKAFFLLVPLFAFLLHLLHRRQRPYYAEHLITALHIHAFAFLLLAARELVEVLAARAGADAGIADTIVWLWIPAHVLLALRRVYGQSWTRTAVKTALLLPTYAAAVGVAMLGVIAVTVAML